jgi:molybdopterin-guanine dinucleotide biosynthesis protein MobB
MKPFLVAVVGGKKSGKTTTMEILIRHLANRGLKICAVKHIPEPDFTIDQEGKDTWKYAKSGAKTVIALSAHEIATIEKTDIKEKTLAEILAKCRECDLVLMEGLKDRVAKDRRFHKIVVVKSKHEVTEAVKTFEPILAFAGPYRMHPSRNQPPYVDVLKSPEKLVDLVERLVSERIVN